MRLARSRRRRLFAPLTLAALALTPAAANATVTTTNITTPSAPVFGTVAYNKTGPYEFEIKGTSDGAEGDPIAIRCYYARNHSRANDGDVAVTTVGADGSFSATGNLENANFNSCVLRAVPEGPDPVFLSPFTGPSMHVGEVSTPYSDNGVDFSLDVSQTQPKGMMRWTSPGECGLIDSRPYFGGPAYASTYAEPWDCAAALYRYDDAVQSSEIVVDGHWAYDSAAQRYQNSDAADRSAVEWSSSIDPVNGNLTITERHVIQRCVADDGTTAVDSSSGTDCAKFVPTNVALERTIAQDHGGLVATVTDDWVSTDGNAHSIRLGYDNWSNYYNSIGHRLPGETEYRLHTTYDGITGIAAAPATVRVRVTDGSDTASYGGLTYTSAPDGIVWTSPDDFIVQYTRTIPAAGKLRLTQVYTQATTDDELTALSRSAEDKVVGPSVSITAPANGSTVTSAAQTVTGTATDNVGVKTLTVNGQPAAVGAGGAFSAPVTLTPGANTITVVATDAEGNSTQAQTVVTYVAAAKTCTVPKVTKKTLTAAKKAIKNAGCVVGKVTAKSSKKVKPGRVISQSRKAGAKVAIGTKVQLTVSKPKPAKKQGKKH